MFSYEPQVFEDTSEIEAAFSREDLKRVCEMHETEFRDRYGMQFTLCDQKAPSNFYLFKDNGSDVLAVAHLDTVMEHARRTANFVDTEAGPIIYSGALDDRLGAYIILELLPKLGITHDILLTVGEESGNSTAEFFTTTKEYNWMIEFDRGGTDVVLYQYENKEMKDLVRDSGARVGDGIFSDISYMEHLGIKGINWGVGYRDYHGPRSHAYLDDTFSMVQKYRRFHEANKMFYYPHEPTKYGRWGGSGSRWGGGAWGMDDDSDDSWVNYRDAIDEADAEADARNDMMCYRIFGKDHMHDDDECAQIMEEFADDVKDFVDDTETAAG